MLFFLLDVETTLTYNRGEKSVVRCVIGLGSDLEEAQPIRLRPIRAEAQTFVRFLSSVCSSSVLY